MQYYLQVADIQTVGKENAPRSKFVRKCTQPSPCALPPECGLRTVACHSVKSSVQSAKDCRYAPAL